MNQTQRTFLIGSIEKQYANERETLKKRQPKAPNLNNYLVAAVLDGTFKLKTSEAIRKAIRERVVKLGQDQTLVGAKSDWRDEDDEPETIVLPYGLLFEPPPAYAEELEKYREALEKWEAESEALDASLEAMKIKVQLGSDKALATLIDQADKLCSMSLTASSKLLLNNAPAQ